MYLLNNFLLFSIFGYFFESFMFELLNMHNQSGFMYLFWTPFYGIGVVIIILVLKLFKNRFKDKNFLLFITLFILLTILEYIGGVLLEILHGYSLWNYKNIPLHIGKYISIPTSLLWTIFASIYILIIKKYTDKLISYIPKILTIILFSIFIFDFILTIIKLLKIQLM